MATPTTIGPYTITRELGRGGMGVVYLASDTRLGRDVAIKALPEHLASDPERLARFEREARTLASLSHPNIAGIYGLEEHAEARYLVLEYVEGQTLAQVLDRGPLPLDEAIELAAQIAAGVEAAHEAGVIHRDLKPGNIIVTPEGKAKVLDFGLARVDESSSSSTGANSDSPTLTSPAIQHSPTMPGVILGTAAYMSPEQARGRKVDKRTDIWSFGVVLYEMLTGVSPFHGETVSDSIGAVLHKELDLDRLPPDTPASVRRVLRHCLERDKNQRYRDIGDVRIELTHPSDQPEVTIARAEPSPLRTAAIAVAVLLAGAAGFLLHRLMTPPPAGEGPLHVSIPIGANSQAGRFGGFALSPVSRTIAFVSSDPADTSDSSTPAVFIRHLDSGEARRLPGTEHAESVSFSPNGSQIAFVWDDPDSAREEVRRVRVDGGPVLTIITDRSGREFNLDAAPLWISNDEIIVHSEDTTVLYRVPTSGGAPIEFATFPLEGGWVFNFVSSRIDEHTVFLNRGHVSTNEFVPSIFRLDLRTGETEQLLSNAYNPRLLPGGRLVFMRDGAICITRFDRASQTVAGGVTPLISGLLSGSFFDISSRGDLCFVRGAGAGASAGNFAHLMTIDRGGARAPLIATRKRFNGRLAVSDDGRRVSVSIEPIDDGPPDAYVVDLETGFIRPVFTDDNVTLSAGWAPDGREVFVHWYTPTHTEIKLIDPGVPTSISTPLPEDDGVGEQYSPTFTPDGRFMLFQYYPGDKQRERGIYAIDLHQDENGREPIPLITSSSEVGSPTLSPDGAYFAFITNTSGRNQVMLRSFDPERPAESSRVYPVSFDGGTDPFWSDDGGELFFLDLEGKHLMSAAVATDPSLVVSPPELVLTAEQIMCKDNFGFRRIAAMPDGERFVFVESVTTDETITSLNLILNWIEALPVTDN